MKVAYVICTLGHGRGGHFHSLAVIAEALQSRIGCVIVNIGVQPSTVLQNSSVPFEFIYFDGRDTVGCRKKLIERITELNPDVLHSFDGAAHFWARMMGLSFDLPVVHNKCGGPNPRRYYPFAKYIITFSQENTQFFKQSRRHRHSQIEHIPNRSTGVSVDDRRVRRLLERCDTGCHIVMRISRFSPAYQRSLIQSIDLVAKLNSLSSKRFQLVLVGAIQNPAVYKTVRAHATKDVVLVTDKYFTNVASQLLGLADAVVATGRGVMEAASLGKVILVPSDNSKLPVLMTPENVDELFAKNFSPRVEPANSASIDDVAVAITDSVTRERLEAGSRRLFRERFLVDNAVERYIGVYQAASVDNRIRLFDLALNFLVAKRYFDRARRDVSNRAVVQK